jgi:hypothetical protein
VPGGEAILVVVVVAAVLFAVFAIRQHNRSTVAATYARLAAELGGTLHKAGFFGRPAIDFRHRGLAARLDVQATGGEGRSYYTQLHLEWPDRTLRCEVLPAGLFGRIGKLLGMSHVEIGAPFDANYIVTGDSPERIRKLLSPGVQIAVDRLQRSLGGGNAYVSFHGGTLLVKKKGYLREYRNLRQFVRLALELCDQAGMSGDEGITFLDVALLDDAALAVLGDSSAPGSSGRVPVCQVCGDEITDRVVHCRSCRTPHHEDCWRYYGACSTYGCGEHRFRRPV